MRKYLVAVRHIRKGFERFEIEANNKREAIEKARFIVSGQTEIIYGGCYSLEHIICARKIRE